jgi:hypothetical protein
MPIARTGASLSNGNFVPKTFSTLMQALYHTTHVVPLISNRDYEGDINKVGDTVYIRKTPSVETFDYTIGQDLEKQGTLADDMTSLTIDYGTYFNVPLNDVDEFMSDIDIQKIVGVQGALAIGDRIERRVLQSVWSSASSTITAAAVDATNALKFVRQSALALTQLNVPDDKRWMVLDPIFAYFLLGSELRLATTTGGINNTNSTYKIAQPICGFDIYVSNNLLANGSTSKILFGHMDALSFASKFQKSEIVRDTKDFADLVRSLSLYGYKVTKAEAMGCINVTSFGAL